MPAASASASRLRTIRLGRGASGSANPGVVFRRAVLGVEAMRVWPGFPKKAYLGPTGRWLNR
jgi:hypothetical protein